MAMDNLAKVYAKWVHKGTKKFANITPEELSVEVYEILEDMVKNGELTEDELNDLLEAE